MSLRVYLINSKEMNFLTIFLPKSWSSPGVFFDSFPLLIDHAKVNLDKMDFDVKKIYLARQLAR